MNPLYFSFDGRIVVIAPECLGYRSLAIMAFLAVFLCIWKRPGLLRSLGVLASACLLAVIGNVLRISFLCGLAAFNVNDAIFGTCHDMAGYAVMFIEAMLLGSIFDRARRAAETATTTPDANTND